MYITVRRQLAVLHANLSVTLLNNLQPINTNNETTITLSALLQVSHILCVITVEKEKKKSLKCLSYRSLSN